MLMDFDVPRSSLIFLTLAQLRCLEREGVVVVGGETPPDLEKTCS